MGPQIITDLDKAIKIFSIHERGVNDYLRDIHFYFNPGDVHGRMPAFDRYWTAIYKKLKDDKVLFEDGNSIIWTVEGQLFRDSTFWFFRDRPYANRRFRERLQLIWKIAKITAATLNALAILWLAWKQIQH